MRRLVVAILAGFLLAPLAAHANPPPGVPNEIVVPTALIEQIYAYLKDRPFADVSPLIDGMRAAVAKAQAKPPSGSHPQAGQAAPAPY